ncbi:Oxysterol-binding protein-domain-containing protein [Sporodiniella umbellata]|nr:Oxysterol-binding protein-domain-containing protein [Sporodiniella umbellata]
MEVVQVQPRDSYLYNIYVPTKGTAIRWSFTTRRNNISFGIFRRKEKEPLPNSSDIVFRAQHQPLQKRQMSVVSIESNHDVISIDDDIEATYATQNSQHTNRPRSKSVATVKLKEGGLDEIVPIQNFQSSSQKIEGTYEVESPGNYVLVFDNTFSRNTPKMLTYTIALGNPEDVKEHKDEVSGWLLKKKRKRMQGWAKRWFTLSPTGVLSYSTSPGSVIRGSIQIIVSTISYNPKLRQFHIDSGTMIYHLKTLTMEDFDSWSEALKGRNFNEPSPDQLVPPMQSNISLSTAKRVSSRNLSVYNQSDKKLKADIEQGVEMSSSHQHTINQLMEILDDIKQYLPPEALDRLEHQKTMVISGAQEQAVQWLNAQNCLLKSRGSGSVTPVPTQESAILERDEHNLHRAASFYSQASGYSEQFYDAQDIDISEDEDDSIVDQTSSIEYDNGSSEEETDSRDSSSAETLNLQENNNVQRRTQLPCPAESDAGSALSVIRKNVGKDLSTIAMPITMNEPLNMLQKSCEELEYCELLEKASTLSDPIERLMYVTVFSISTYASTQHRTGRKPFNPMMTETYESIRPDKGFRFVSEKVSHVPLTIATHAEAKGFKYWQSTEIKSKFWGKSMEFMTEGTFHVSLTGQTDHYTFFKPSSWMKNMIAGEKYLEHSGECKVTNQTTGDYATVVFKEGTGGGLFGAPTKRNDVVATIYDSQGNKKRRVTGKWSETLVEEVDLDKNKLSVLWTAHPPGVPDHAKYYGFTKFATELNEITELEDKKLPITDTRLRPDQQLYEQGQVDEADKEKLRIEQQQREKRKEFENAGVEWKPRWFTREGDEWVYSGHYWQARETGQWPKDMFPLW